MSQPDFSVLVPLYNGGRFIAECLDSVAAQTHPSWECIVVDDASQDDSWQRLANWRRERGVAVTMLRNPEGRHSGLPATRNRAVAHATGRWLAFLDQDDCWLPGKLAEQARYLSDNPDVDAVSCYPALVYESADRRHYIEIWAQSVRTAATPGGRIPFASFLTGCPFFMSGAAVRREALLSAGGFNVALPRTYDWLLWACLASRRPLGVVAKPLATYRLHEGNMMSRLAGEPCGLPLACLELHEHLIDWVATDRGISRGQAEAYVHEHVDWHAAARAAGIDRETWFAILAGSEDRHAG